MTLYMKIRHARFLELNTFIHKLICVKNNCYPESIENEEWSHHNEQQFCVTRTYSTTP